MPKTHCLRVWGDLACFTRPEMKVERFSYPVITPSAARGILDAIYVKPPEFRWQVTRIDVLQAPEYIALRRNEVKNKASESSVRRAMQSGARHLDPVLADETAEATGRTQRQTMALRNVSYRLYAEIRPWKSCPVKPAALDEQFQRRATAGKCFFQPSFGCREFPAYFEYIESPETLPPPPAINLEIGWMLYDTFDLSRPGNSTSHACISVFWAKVENGVLLVPEFESADVRKCREVEC